MPRISVPGGRVDHLVVAAPDLESGSDWLRRKLGFSPQTGGEHALMGTHNRVLRLGETSYIEVIAPNPKASAPGRPRWFALDSLNRTSAPRLATWVVRVADIEAGVANCSEALGPAQAMSRSGLNWLITVPDDGCLLLGGAAPALIEWRTPAHPASAMQDHGLALERLEILHPEPERVERLLETIGFEGPVSVERSEAIRLTSRIATTCGSRTL